MSPGSLLEYRFFVVNDRNEVQFVRFALCENDAEAERFAEALRAEDGGVEVWDVGRLVAEVHRDRLN